MRQLTYALFKLGAILVPLNPAFTPAQVASALSHLAVSHLVIGAENNLPYKPPLSNAPILTHLVPDLYAPRVASECVPSLESIILVDNSTGHAEVSAHKVTTPYNEVLNDYGDGSQSLADRKLHKDDIVNIQFTSGTTSMPKAACLTHRSILNNGKSIGDRMLLTPQDVICCQCCP